MPDVRKFFACIFIDHNYRRATDRYLYICTVSNNISYSSFVCANCLSCYIKRHQCDICISLTMNNISHRICKDMYILRSYKNFRHLALTNFMLFIRCLFLRTIYHPTNALHDQSFMTYITSIGTCFGTDVLSSGSRYNKCV